MTLADYTQATADTYETSSTITFTSPCSRVGDTNLAWTTFTADPDTFTDDAYTTVSQDFDVTDLFTVEADFCLDTLTFACTGVSGPDGSGGTKVYNIAGTDYPATLCSLTSNVLTVSAGPDQYKEVNDLTKHMRPGVYTFTITATTVSETGVT